MRFILFFVCCWNTWAAAVNGIVLDSLSGLPVTGASIHLRTEASAPAESFSAKSGSDGRFLIPDVAPGLYLIRCTHPGHVEAYGWPTKGPNVDVKPGGGTDPAVVTIRLVPGTIISGRVVFEDGRPIPDARVEPGAGASRAVMTNAAGEFEFTGLEPCPKDCLLHIQVNEYTRRAFSEERPAGSGILKGPPEWNDKVMETWSAGQQIRNVEIRITRERLVTFSGVIADAPQRAGVHSFAPTESVGSPRECRCGMGNSNSNW